MDDLKNLSNKEELKLNIFEDFYTNDYVEKVIETLLEKNVKQSTNLSKLQIYMIKEFIICFQCQLLKHLIFVIGKENLKKLSISILDQVYEPLGDYLYSNTSLKELEIFGSIMEDPLTFLRDFL